jgi:hypothetical protein
MSCVVVIMVTSKSNNDALSVNCKNDFLLLSSNYLLNSLLLLVTINRKEHLKCIDVLTPINIPPSLC